MLILGSDSPQHSPVLAKSESPAERPGTPQSEGAPFQLAYSQRASLHKLSIFFSDLDDTLERPYVDREALQGSGDISRCQQHAISVGMLPAGAAFIEGNIVATLAGYFCAIQTSQRHNRTAVSKKDRSAIICISSLPFCLRHSMTVLTLHF